MWLSGPFVASALAASPPPLIGAGGVLPASGSVITASWLTSALSGKIIVTSIGLSAALSITFIVIGGYRYLTAMGVKEQIEKAHKTILWALLGLLLSILAYPITQILVSINF